MKIRKPTFYSCNFNFSCSIWLALKSCKNFTVTLLCVHIHGNLCYWAVAVILHGASAVRFTRRTLVGFSRFKEMLKLNLSDRMQVVWWWIQEFSFKRALYVTFPVPPSLTPSIWIDACY